MQVTTKITVDLTRPNIGGRVNAVQGDGNTRQVEITLLAGGVPWTPPDGMEAAIAYYTQPSGTKGMYNLLADGTAAISISGNVATIILAPQMLTASGTVQASLVFNDSQLNRLTTFPFAVSVTSNPAAGAQKTEDYIRLQWLEDKLDEYLKKFEGGVDEATVQRIVDEYLAANPPTVTVDSELSETSENPVQNKVVTAAINQLSGGNVDWRDPEDDEVFILDEESSGGETPENPGTNVPVTGISLNKSTLSLIVGKSEVLIADITPDNATNLLVNWTTSNSGVAIVTSDGTVTAVGEGDAVITATSRDTTNGVISASCSVSCAEAESGGDTGGGNDDGLDIPSTNLMAYYDLRKPLNDSGQIVDLSGNGIDLTLADNKGLALGDGYISRENEETYMSNWVPASSGKDLPINGAVTVFATISNYENKTTPILTPGKGANITSIVLFGGGVIFYDGAFNNVTADTQIDASESYHVIAVSLETGGNEKIYINGVLKSDVTVKNVPAAGNVQLLSGYASHASTKLRLHNAAFYSSVLDDETVAAISSTLKTNAGGAA